MQGNGSAFTAATAPDGTQTAFLNYNSSLSQSVTLSTAGNYTLTFKASQRSCCTTPYAQTVAISIDGNVVGQVTPTATTGYVTYSYPLQLSAGTHTIKFAGKATIDNTAFLDTVALTGVLSVDMAAPANNSTRSNSTPIALTATPTEPGGTIAKVDFYRGTALIGTATAALYTVNWSNATPGSHTITAKATDVLGATAVSAPIALTVYDAPTIDLTGPAVTSPLLAPATASFSATAAASGANNTVTQVAFYNGTAFLGSTTTAPYALTWSAIPAGSYSVTAVVTDSVGGSATSRALGVTVIDNLPPTVSLQASPTTATAPATIALTASATDADGTIAGVAFYNGTQLLGTVEQAPYRYTWHDVVPGNYHLTARATDQVGGTTVSSPVTVQVSGAPATVYYIDSDQVNTPRLITDAANRVVWRWDHDEPFGYHLPNDNPSGLGTFVHNPRFPGQYFDWETGLHYNYFRDYDPSSGRYIESDPIGLAGGINTYAYALQNPMSYVDTLGLDVGWGQYGDLSRTYASNRAMAEAAKKHIGEGGWGRPGYRGGLGWLTKFKCNLFDNQVASEAGAIPPMVNGRPATAGELGDPSVNIPGWPVVTDGSVNDGDIIAIAHSGLGYSGHTGVVARHNGSPFTVSANSNTKTITWNDWGFRPGQDPVVRRCECSQ